MVSYLFNLRSTNAGGVKQVHVWVANDSAPANTTIEFLIDGKPYNHQVSLLANNQIAISVTHNEEGSSEPVSARERTSGQITQKLLDLDAAESY